MHKTKFPGKEDLIDERVRENMLGLCKIIAAMECYYSMNHYGERDRKINENNKIAKCLRYSKVET